MAVETDILPSRYGDARRIGHGGMGEIYLATDDTLGRAVAVKLLSERYAHDHAIRGRFTREALAAARLSGDPNTVTIFDVGEWNGRPFIVMEYLAGGSLGHRLREEGAQPPGRVLEWVAQVARALDAAHAKGVVHRDVKPENLLLDGDGNVHVADFGIATAAGLDSLTQTGTVLGTAGYFSPEQAEGLRAGPASDIYALGVVAFELLAGARPYESDSATAEAAAHAHAPIPSVSARRPGLPRELDPVFQRVLAKAPEVRYPTGNAFADALRTALAPRARADPESTTIAVRPEPMPRRSRSRLLPLVAAGMLILGAAGAALAALLAGDSADGEGSQQARASTIVRTVTAAGRTVQETVTTTLPAEPPAPPPPPPSPTAPSSGANGAELNDQGFARMQAGDYEGALPLLEQAVAELQGTGSLAEAYASYNLAFTRFALGRCDSVLELLARSKAVQGPRREITDLRRDARRTC